MHGSVRTQPLTPLTPISNGTGSGLLSHLEPPEQTEETPIPLCCLHFSCFAFPSSAFLNSCSRSGIDGVSQGPLFVVIRVNRARSLVCQMARRNKEKMHGPSGETQVRSGTGGSQKEVKRKPEEIQKTGIQLGNKENAVPHGTTPLQTTSLPTPTAPPCPTPSSPLPPPITKGLEVFITRANGRTLGCPGLNPTGRVGAEFLERLTSVVSCFCVLMDPPTGGFPFLIFVRFSNF